MDIFYDFTPAHVSSSAGARLAESLRHFAADTARSSLALVRALGETAASHAPPLGLFGRIRKDDQGRVDLKSGGLLPIVAGARAIALRHGVTALSTRTYPAGSPASRAFASRTRKSSPTFTASSSA
ncbi:putative nucleotidyltransferase substrate binding domain-containing protein [Pannonibacter sp. Pt2-lr]